MRPILSRFNRLLAAAALVLGAGCEADEYRIPPDTRSNPIAPVFLFFDVRASRNTATAGDTEHPVIITVQANRADNGAPVDNGTIVALSATMGSFDAPDGPSALDLELFNGVADIRYFPPLDSLGGTARIRGELVAFGFVDVVEITIQPGSAFF